MAPDSSPQLFFRAWVRKITELVAVAEAVLFKFAEQSAKGRTGLGASARANNSSLIVLIYKLLALINIWQKNSIVLSRT